MEVHYVKTNATNIPLTTNRLPSRVRLDCRPSGIKLFVCGSIPDCEKVKELDVGEVEAPVLSSVVDSMERGATGSCRLRFGLRWSRSHSWPCLAFHDGLLLEKIW